MREVTNTWKCQGTSIPSEWGLRSLPATKQILVFSVRSIRFNHSFSLTSAVSPLTFQGNVKVMNHCH